MLCLIFIFIQSSSTFANEAAKTKGISFLYITILYTPIHNIYIIDKVVDQLKELKFEHEALKLRVGFLEIENKDQKEDIQFLNIQLSEIKQNDDALMKNIHLKGENENVAVVMTNKQRRPARLFPASILL